MFVVFIAMILVNKYLQVSMRIYIYIYTHNIYIYTHNIYIYIYIINIYIYIYDIYIYIYISGAHTRHMVEHPGAS